MPAKLGATETHITIAQYICNRFVINFTPNLFWFIELLMLNETQRAPRSRATFPKQFLRARKCLRENAIELAPLLDFVSAQGKLPA